MVELPEKWYGSWPFFLLIVTKNNTVHSVIDLEEPEWRAKYEDNIMREPGQWYLARKHDRSVVFALNVEEGEQPYYVLKHVGYLGGVEDNPTQHEMGAFGLGKKRLDGHVDRMWILPNGLVCGGNDLDFFVYQALNKPNPMGS